MTDTALTDGLGNALTDGAGNALIFSFTSPPQPPAPIPDFATCVSLAEMHRQAAYLAARIAFSGDYGAFQRQILVADHQYFLDVLSCCTQFNETAPSATDGLKDTTNQLLKTSS